jgi:hypothetical protein
MSHENKSDIVDIISTLISEGIAVNSRSMFIPLRQIIMPVTLRTDDRGVSEVIGAVLLFGMLIIAFSSYQAFIIPDQNTDIEAQHYQQVQGDLGKLQGTIITAAETGEARSTSVNLGPSYPSRAVGVNSGPPSGQLRAVPVGSGQISSSAVPLDKTCRLQAGNTDTVPTNALVYEPGYNYYQSGDVSHRLEETLLYQTPSAYGSALTRNDQAMVDAPARSVTLYPLQSDVQSRGTGDETYRFVGGYGQSQTVSDATVTIPTQAPVTVWQDQIADGNPDIAVANNDPEAINITFTGSWEFNCQPVGQDSSPDQVPTADAGTDTSVPEGSTVELDGTQSQATGSITTYSWTLIGSIPAGVSLSDSATSTPVFDASDADVSSDTDVTAELTVTDRNGNTHTDTVTVTVTQTSSGNGDGGGNGGGDGSGTSPGDPGFAQCSNPSPNAINIKEFSGPSYDEDMFNVKKVDIRDNDGDSDLTELEFELVENPNSENGGTVVATDEVTVNDGKKYNPGGNPSYSISTGSYELDDDNTYELTVVAYDVDGNCRQDSLSVIS